MRLLGLKTAGFDPSLFDALRAGDFSAIRDVVEVHDCLEDAPWCMLFRLLDCWYPDSLFILTERQDPVTWERSARAHDGRNTDPIAIKAGLLTVGYGLGVGADMSSLRTLHSAHGAAVRAYFANGGRRFVRLCWEEGDGWPELCAALEVPVPQGLPFPHENRDPVRP